MKLKIFTISFFLTLSFFGCTQLTTESKVMQNSFISGKDEVTLFTEKLVELGILPKEKMAVILNEYDNKTLEGKYSILAHSDKCQIIDLSSYPTDPEIIYKSIFKKIKPLLLNFNFSEFDVNLIELDMDEELIEQQLMISFKIDGQIYQHQFFHDFKRIKNFKPHHKNDKPNKISTEFHKGINKYLTNSNSNLRLHTINIPDSESIYGQEKIGLIVLNKQQADFFRSDSYFLSDESFSNSFNSSNLDVLLTDFDSLGLFSHLSDKEKEQSRQKLYSKEITSYYDIFFEYPNSIIVFDWETGNLENPYEELTVLFGKASRGVFVPMSIKDDFSQAFGNSEQVNFEFTFNEKKYSKTLKMESDWLDPRFMMSIENAITENGVDGKFHFIYDNGQETGFIFLNTKQYNFIKQNYPDFFVE